MPSLVVAILALWSVSSSVPVGTFKGDKPRKSAQQEQCPEDLSRIYGRIQFVEHFADCRVKVVEHFEDMRVQVVEHFADSVAKWEIVEHFPDYIIQLVEHFPDFTIRYVEHFPGVSGH